MSTTPLRQTITHGAVALLLLGAGAASLPPPAAAQTTTVARTPRVNALQLNADGGLSPGSQLQFRVEGTPRGRASVRINDSNVVVALRETAPGVYRGTHTVRRTDRIDPTGLLRASVTLGNLTTTNNFTFPPAFVALAQPRQQAQPPVQQQAEAARIDRFELRSQSALEPGTQVRLVMQGAAGGQASANIPGVVRNIPLREVRPGIYRGSYTVRKQDNLNNFASAAATLRLAGQSVSANLTEPLAAGIAPAPAPATQVLGSAGPLALQVYSHVNNATVDGGLTQVRGRTAPNALVRVRVDAVPPVIGQRAGVAQQVYSDTVQADEQGNFSFTFDPRTVPVPGTRYEVSMNATSGAQTAETRLVLMQRG